MELTDRVRAVFKHGQFVGGPEVAEAERAMAEYIGVKHAVSCNSGTDAILNVLRVLGARGGHVAVPAFTFSADAAAVVESGAELVFVDINETNFSIDVSTIDECIDCIDIAIVVDMFGIPADWNEISEWGEKNDVFLIEDACQAIGASYNGVKCGSLGDIGCTSFYPSKPLSCAGDGGMIFTDNLEIAEPVKRRCNHGRADCSKYVADSIGLNSRLDTIQAAVLLDRMDRFESREVHSRSAQAFDYSRYLGGKHYVPKDGFSSIWSWYPVLYEDQRERDEVLRKYEPYGARAIYPVPLHLQPAFAYLGHKRGDFPVSESVCERIVAFPIVHHWEVNKCLSSIMNAESARADSK